ISQLFENPRTLAVTGGVLGTLGLIPGMPNMVFLSLGAAAGAGSWLIWRRRTQAAGAGKTQAGAPAPAEAVAPENRDLSWDDVVPVDAIGLEVGYRLIPLVDKNQGGQLMPRI